MNVPLAPAVNMTPDPSPGRLRIIALAPNDWDGMWMNRQQLLSRIGKSYPVLYSTGGRSTWDREPWSSGAGGPLGKFVNRGGVTVDHAPSLLHRVPGAPLVDRIVTGLITSRWRRHMRRRGSGPLAAYLFHPSFESFVEPLGPDYLIYHAYDLFNHDPSWNDALERRQERLLRSAHLIIGSSAVIAEALRSAGSRPVFTVPNGVDFASFAGASRHGREPQDIAGIPHPRIGHIGRLNAKVDIELIVALARANPQWHFVLVGPLVDLGPRDAALYVQSREIANVHLLGMKSLDELPHYMHALDVGLLAYRSRGLWTAGIYPLKLHEYLACGLPIVSTDIPAVRQFSEVVRIAVDVHDWSDAIRAALEDNGADKRARRVEIARENSWDNRAELVCGLLRRLPAGGVPGKASLARATAP